VFPFVANLTGRCMLFYFLNTMALLTGSDSVTLQ